MRPIARTPRNSRKDAEWSAEFIYLFIRSSWTRLTFYLFVVDKANIRRQEAQTIQEKWWSIHHPMHILQMILMMKKIQKKSATTRRKSYQIHCVENAIWIRSNSHQKHSFTGRSCGRRSAGSRFRRRSTWSAGQSQINNLTLQAWVCENISHLFYNFTIGRFSSHRKI